MVLLAHVVPADSPAKSKGQATPKPMARQEGNVSWQKRIGQSPWVGFGKLVPGVGFPLLGRLIN